MGQINKEQHKHLWDKHREQGHKMQGSSKHFEQVEVRLM